jgi:DNA-binding MarR family transcriptional regulator
MNELQSVGFLIKKIHDAIGAIVNMELKELNLTLSQSDMLCFLNEVRGQRVSVRELEHHFCIKHATAIGIVNRLENKGFISSSESPDDKRVRNIEITSKGEQIQEAILPKCISLEENYLEGLTAAEVDSLKRALTVIHSNLQELK